jgi:DNA-binding NarL/FixJ family response regulator
MSRNQQIGKRAARVLIVDDHPAVREALSIRISAQTGLNVCGEAADVAEALRLVEATDPDIAVVDIALKTGDGIDLIRRIRARDGRVRMLVWSMYSEILYAERALRAGAMGYINKEQGTTTIIEAIRQILGGKVYLSAAMTEKLLKRSVGQDPCRLPIDTLSDRELEVFRLIGQGVKTQDIATQMHLSTKTVETYRDRIRRKMDLGDGAELSRAAFQWVIENGGGPGAEPANGI